MTGAESKAGRSEAGKARDDDEISLFFSGESNFSDSSEDSDVDEYVRERRRAKKKDAETSAPAPAMTQQEQDDQLVRQSYQSNNCSLVVQKACLDAVADCMSKRVRLEFPQARTVFFNLIKEHCRLQQYEKASLVQKSWDEYVGQRSFQFVFSRYILNACSQAEKLGLSALAFKFC